MMSLREKRQIIIFVAVGVMVAGFILFFYLPVHKKKMSLQSSKADRLAAVADIEYKSRKLPALTEELKNLKEKVSDFEKQIPADRNLGMFLQKIAELMDKQNLKNQQVRPSGEVKIEGLNCISVEMQCEGTLKQIYEFYKNLQGIDRLIRVEQVKLENDRELSGNLSMLTKAVIYYQVKTGDV